MKKIMGVVFGVMFLLSAGLAYAIPQMPTLQLDIAGGYYDFATETIISTSKEFSLYAYFIFVDKNSVEVDQDNEKIKVPERFMIWLDRQKDAKSKRTTSRLRNITK